MKQNHKKANQIEFKVEKVINKNSDNLYVNLYFML